MHAVATDRHENFAIATGQLDEDMEAIIVMDSATGDLNLRGTMLHLAGDAAVSLGVVAAAVVMGAVHGAWWLDPLIALGVAADRDDSGRGATDPTLDLHGHHPRSRRRDGRHGRDGRGDAGELDPHVWGAGAGPASEATVTTASTPVSTFVVFRSALPVIVRCPTSICRIMPSMETSALEAPAASALSAAMLSLAG